MNEPLNCRRREAFLALIAEALPGHGRQPAAVELDLADETLEPVFRSRPELCAPFEALLDRYSPPADSFIAGLDDTEFNRLMLVLCAAYLQHPRVREALGYWGQQALTPNRSGLFGCEDLVLEMLEKPKRFRPV